MTMLSFRAPQEDVDGAEAWAKRLQIERSELLRRALHSYLTRSAVEDDAEAWEHQPLDSGELALAEASDWGPAEDWSDWSDA